jgi:hypothetical protein
MKTILAAMVSLMTAMTALQAASWSSLETREGVADFITNHCFAGTPYILLDNGLGNFVHEKSDPSYRGSDYYPMQIVFAVSKGYGYSVGPFSGVMGISIAGPKARTWEIGLDGGSPGPTGRWQ